jgi:hypothetical protein
MQAACAMQQLFSGQVAVSVAFDVATSSVAVLQGQTCLILAEGKEMKVVKRAGLPPAFIAVEAAKLLSMLKHMRCRLLQQHGSNAHVYWPMKPILLLTREQHLMLLVISQTRQFFRFIDNKTKRYQRLYEALVACVCRAAVSRLFLTIESQAPLLRKRSRLE